jgi:phosphoribosylglycinamide formyltransferase 1
MKIAVFASGKGSNFETILKWFQNKKEVETECLVCDQPNALALGIAQRWGIEIFPVFGSKFKSRLEPHLEKEISDYLLKKKVDLIVLAGYMRIVKEPLLKEFNGRMINIHPSLLPSFPGLHAVRQALDYGVKVTGCTVHYIDEKIDHGPILAQRAVEVEEGESEENLLEKIHQMEHVIYPQVIEKLARQYFKGKGLNQ